VTPRVRLAVLVAGVAALAGLALVLPLESLPHRVATFGPLGPVAAVLLGAALLAALVPRTPISLACGALFGLTMGTVCAVAVTLVAAVVTFTAGRLLGREALLAHLAARTRGRLVRLERSIAEGGTLSVAAVRALPLGPHGLAGYAYGTTAVRVRDYLLGTLIAAVPSAVSYAVLGAAVVRPGAFSPVGLVPIGVGLALSTTILTRAVLRHRRQRHQPQDRTVPSCSTDTPPAAAAS
jgi:uncharacterized membrane protein YdjX (TVP38/TMEM64 family)